MYYLAVDIGASSGRHILGKFENGKVVEAKAEKGEKLLQEMVSMDEGAGKLGECALIPYDSPMILPRPYASGSPVIIWLERHARISGV